MEVESPGPWMGSGMPATRCAVLSEGGDSCWIGRSRLHNMCRRPLQSSFSSSVSSEAASIGVGVLGWGLALAPVADHMRLECADVSLGAPAGPQTPPSIWTGEWAPRPLSCLAEEETGGFGLQNRVLACLGALFPQLCPRNIPDLLSPGFSLWPPPLTPTHIYSLSPLPSCPAGALRLLSSPLPSPPFHPLFIAWDVSRGRALCGEGRGSCLCPSGRGPPVPYLGHLQLGGRSRHPPASALVCIRKIRARGTGMRCWVPES